MCEERKPHKHAEVIKAWADGKAIQAFSNASQKWKDVDDPGWYENTKYRIKPNKVKVEYWVTLHKDAQGYYCQCSTTDNFTKSKTYVRTLHHEIIYIEENQ